MMALLALMILMMFSMGQQRAVLHARLNMVDSEIETIATSVGREILDRVGLKPFDAATVDADVSDPTELTPLPFNTGGTFEGAQDIDDFHEVVAFTYTSEFGNVPFEIELEVRYVDDEELSEVITTQSFAKEAIVTMTNENLPSPIKVSRVFTYP